VYVLRAIDYGWACRRCDRQRWSQIEVSAATYAMGLRIGYRGRPMVLRRDRLTVALRNLVRRARAVEELVPLIYAEPLLHFSPHWPRRRRDGRSREAFGPLLRKLGPLYIATVIDNLLHPVAFLERYGRG
jgi:hypothetical protein